MLVVSEGQACERTKALKIQRSGYCFLFGLGLMSLHVARLRINPATRSDGGNVLHREVILLTMNDVFLHELVQLVKVEKRDHGVTAGENTTKRKER